MTKDMTTGSPLKSIILFTIPVLIGNLFQQFYNMVDAIIVGQYLGADVLAAVGATSCLMFLVIGFANGIAQGFGIMVAHAFGAKDNKMLRHYVALSLMLTVIISAILTIPTVAASEKLLVWMNTPDNILQMSNSYLRVIFAGVFCTMAYNVAAGILRGIGDSKTPLYFLILSSVLNIGLDVFLIVVVPLGTAGAAYATVISQGISAVLCFVVMFWRFEILRIKKEDCYFDFASIRKMLTIGIPMALNYSITAIGCVILQAAVNIYGSSVVAAFTAASKVSNIAMQPFISLGTTMSTYCGQNLGANDHKRIFQGMQKGVGICLVLCTISSLFCTLGGPYVVGWFINDPSEEIMYYAMHYLKIISWYTLPLCAIFYYRNALQGLDKGFIPMVSGLVELACRFVVLELFAERFGYDAVCYADAVTWVVTGLLLVVTYFLWKRKAVTARCEGVGACTVVK